MVNAMSGFISDCLAIFMIGLFIGFGSQVVFPTSSTQPSIIGHGTVTFHIYPVGTGCIAVASDCFVDGETTSLTFGAYGMLAMPAVNSTFSGWSWSNNVSLTGISGSHATLNVAGSGTVVASFLNVVTNPVSILSNTTYTINSITPILNVSVSGPSGKVGYLNITLARSLINGTTAITLIDNGNTLPVIPVVTTYDPCSCGYAHIYVVYPLSSHVITVQGSKTIPEFPAIALVAFSALLLSLVVLKRKKKAL